ncbi:hypothetical protein GWK47_008734 [Chionoecetes opilio]|uniref:Uncharacterized protein n=1 Tax=Chionoecetes opilio TaxID=41210 RepID=A0A8J4XZI4_CHIOP|nr:hypothetical protein GWK47_008734 [Chionoecetes opilio]
MSMPRARHDIHAISLASLRILYVPLKTGAGSASAAGPSSSPRRTSHKSRSQTASPRGESKKILRHLVTPPVGHRTASFDEFLHLRSQNPKCSVERTRSADIATELLRTEGSEEAAEASGLMRETSLTSFVASPSKHDKKVTFAKLLDKMSKEMSSSSSDMSCTEEKSPSRIFNFGGVRRSPRRSPRIRHTQSPHGSELEDSSAHASPSTTPTTPQKALPQVKQDTLTVPGSLQVQVQAAGGAAHYSGPVITLEVPAGDQHRCLSPITELPTPVPTPMPSPLPTPSRYRPKMRTSSESNDNKDSEDTESEFSLSISVERSSSDSSGPDHRVFFTPTRGMRGMGGFGALGAIPRPPGTLSPTITPSSSISSRTPSPVTSPAASPATSPKIKTKPPPLHIPDANVLLFSGEKSNSSGCDGGAGGGKGCEVSVVVPVIMVEDIDQNTWRPPPPCRPRAFSVDVGRVMAMPLITVSPADEPPAAPARLPAPATQPLIIPTLNVTMASPPAIRKQIPPMVPTISIEEPPPQPPPRRHHHDLLQRGKGGSLDLPAAPAITVTATSSEVESDTDSPTAICRPRGPSSCYLSPFLGVDLRASESNLSSSGYSSAYSPGPSRCSSINPLCLDEPMTPSPLSTLPSQPLTLPLAPTNITTTTPRTKRHPLLKSPQTEVVSIEVVPSPLLRTDSETTDPAASQPEADSALELDTNDEYSDSLAGGVGVGVGDLCLDEAEAQRHRLLLSSSHSFPKESPRLSRCPPAIVVHSSLHSESSLEDQVLGELPPKLSPVSSRSESPISDSRLSVVRIYPAFFGKNSKPEMPYTDSDGLYDCPSSEVLHSDSHASSPLKRLGRKRLKRSPGKGLRSLLGLGSNEGGAGGGGGTGAGTGPGAGGAGGLKTRLEPPSWDRSSRRHSPKRRVRAQTSVDLLSSSNESITSTRYLHLPPPVPACTASTTPYSTSQHSRSPPSPSPKHYTWPDRNSLLPLLVPSRLCGLLELWVSPPEPRGFHTLPLLAGSTSGLGETAKQHDILQQQQQQKQQKQQQQQQRGRDSWWGAGGGGGGGRRRRPLLRTESIPLKYLPRQGSVDASGEETQEEQMMLKPGRPSEEMPRHRKISRFRSFGNQIRFLRRLQLSHAGKDHLVSPAGSSDSDPECGPPAGAGVCASRGPSPHVKYMAVRHPTEAGPPSP